MSELHAWHPHGVCDLSCVRTDSVSALGQVARVGRVTYRLTLVAMLLLVMPLLAVPFPGQTRVVRSYWRFFTWSIGVRVVKSGGPIRNVPGVLVVSQHVSWIDAFIIYSLMPTAFVAKAEVTRGLAFGTLARVIKTIPIDRAKLRLLPDVVNAVAERLASGQSVTAFPEGTTWCGLAHGEFRPAMFQAAIDAGRPVQPLRLSYQHHDGRPSTVAAFVGNDALLTSVLRVLSVRPIVVEVHVEELQLPGTHRRELASRCQELLRGTSTARHEHVLVA
jgi:1-acyl-sn-glycerol-3-phosphate acyltransferase